MANVLVGFNRFTSSKSGKVLCVAQIVSDINARESANGFVGKKVLAIYTPQEQVDYLTNNMIGKNIELNYEISGGKPYLSSIKCG